MTTAQNTTFTEIKWSLAVDSDDDNDFDYNPDYDNCGDDNDQSNSNSRSGGIIETPPVRQSLSPQALKALEMAGIAARNFDLSFNIINKVREQSVPLFHTAELVLSNKPIRTYGYTTEYALNDLRVIMDLSHGNFNEEVIEARERLAERVQLGTQHIMENGSNNNGNSGSNQQSPSSFYSVKFLQSGLLESDHGTNAVCDFMVETKLLMNLAPHPHVESIYGVNGAGIDAFCEVGKKHGFFIITDSIHETLSERLETWKKQKQAKEEQLSSPSAPMSLDSILKTVEKPYSELLELAMEIASALMFLHSRDLVFYIRPDKVGFDVRYNRVKLISLSQVRQVGMVEHARSITKSDCMQTLAYTAPEVFCKAPATTSTDVYGFAMVLWHLLKLEMPFASYNRATHFEEVVKHHARPSVAQDWPYEVRELLQQCWHSHQRPTMKHVHDRLEAFLLFAEDEGTQKLDYIETNQKRPEIAPEKTTVPDDFYDARENGRKRTESPVRGRSRSTSRRSSADGNATSQSRARSLARRPSTSAASTSNQNRSRSVARPTATNATADQSRSRSVARRTNTSPTADQRRSRSVARRTNTSPTADQRRSRSIARRSSNDADATRQLYAEQQEQQQQTRPDNGSGLRNSHSHENARAPSRHRPTAQEHEQSETNAQRSKSRSRSRHQAPVSSITVTNDEPSAEPRMRARSKSVRRRSIETDRQENVEGTPQQPNQSSRKEGQRATGQQDGKHQNNLQKLEEVLRHLTISGNNVSKTQNNAQEPQLKDSADQTENTMQDMSNGETASIQQDPVTNKWKSAPRRCNSDDGIPMGSIRRRPSNGSVIQMKPVQRSRSSDDDNSNSVEVFTPRQITRREQLKKTLSQGRGLSELAAEENNNHHKSDHVSSRLRVEESDKSVSTLPNAFDVSSSTGETSVVSPVSENSSLEHQILAAVKSGDETGNRRIMITQKDGSKKIIRVSIRKKLPESELASEQKSRRPAKIVLANKPGLEDDLVRIASGDDARQRSRSKSRTRRGEHTSVSQQQEQQSPVASQQRPSRDSNNKTPMRARSRSRGPAASNRPRNSVGTDDAVSPAAASSQQRASVANSINKEGYSVPSVPIKLTKPKKEDSGVPTTPSDTSKNKTNKYSSPSASPSDNTFATVPKTPFHSLTTQFSTGFDHQEFDSVPFPPMRNYSSPQNNRTSRRLNRLEQSPSSKLTASGSPYQNRLAVPMSDFTANLRAGGDPNPNAVILTKVMSTANIS